MAKLIDDLRNIHHMSVLEIARNLERSKSWVSMRLGIMARMSDCVRQKIFKGEFPEVIYVFKDVKEWLDQYTVQTRDSI